MSTAKASHAGYVKVKGMGISFFALCPQRGGYTGQFQNGVFLTNQWNPLRKPIYTILKLPRDLTMGGIIKKRYPYLHPVE